MNRYQIYELLKQCRPLNKEEINKIIESEDKEVKEGLVEWLIVLNRAEHYQEQLKVMAND